MSVGSERRCDHRHSMDASPDLAKTSSVQHHGSNMFRTTNVLKTSRNLRPCIHPSSCPFFHSLPHNVSRIGRFSSEKSLRNILPTFRDQVARSTGVESFSSRFPRPTIRNQVLVSKLHLSVFCSCFNQLVLWLLSFLSVDLYSRIR